MAMREAQSLRQQPYHQHRRREAAGQGTTECLVQMHFCSSERVQRGRAARVCQTCRSSKKWDGCILALLLDSGTGAPPVRSLTGAPACRSAGGGARETSDSRGRLSHYSQQCQDAPKWDRCPTTFWSRPKRKPRPRAAAWVSWRGRGRAYVAMCVTASLHSLEPVEPPSARTSSV